MSRITVTRKIEAPPDVVFRTVADIREFSKAVTGVVGYEFLSQTLYGLGTRFRLTRVVSGQQTTFDFEIKEFIENSRVKNATDDTRGTVWESLFTVQSSGASSILTMTMEAHCYQWMAKIIVLPLMGVLKHAVEKDMDSVKVFCEKQTPG